eukprot:scaffold7233_cov157-Skeletonema_dohrnii-CCMP3373.AAC.1
MKTIVTHESSKRKRPSSAEEEDRAPKKVGRDRDGRYRKICTAEGCTNLAMQGECALSMEQRSNFAAVMDAQILPSKEECAVDTEQSSQCSVVKDAQPMLTKEECVLGTGQE